MEYLPDEAYIATIGCATHIEAMNPGHIWPYNFRKYTLGWTTWLPLNKPMGHSYRTLLRDEMYIFTDRNYEEERSTLSIVRERIEHHYGVRTEVQWKYRNGRSAIVKVNALEE